MNRTFLIMAIVLIAVLAIISRAFALSERSEIHYEEGVGYVTDAIVVEFSKDILPLDIQRENGAVITGSAEIDALNSRYGVSELSPLFPGAREKGEVTLSGYFTVGFNSDYELIAVLEAYDALTAVDHV
jgi:hypothetical protein